MKDTMNLGSLILSNGTKLTGNLYNFNHQSIHGEVVFNTGMTGYEETLTDPSYAGQILVFTYPLLGNYGASDGSHFESEHIHVKAVVCTNLINNHIHHNAVYSFLDWLKQHNIPLMDGIDTRELTKILRDNGTMDGVITTTDIASSSSIEDINWVNQVSTTEIKYHGNGKYKLILVDFGVKQNIIRSLLKFDVTIKQVPYNYDYSNEEYDGILLSNGPGDPKQCVESIQILKKVLNKDKPIFGICLGSQLMGLAAGADTYKLKFGHRGQNQPCQDIMTNRCYLTSQNHGYAICNNTLPNDWEVTFKHLHDNSIAGIRHKNKPYSAVQFHPEASAGPHDTEYLFAQFINQVSGGSI
jgi:carbamoyl-phosphate synthase small subunit